jgi:hypothetical protein
VYHRPSESYSDLGKYPWPPTDVIGKVVKVAELSDWFGQVTYLVAVFSPNYPPGENGQGHLYLYRGDELSVVEQGYLERLSRHGGWVNFLSGEGWPS